MAQIVAKRHPIERKDATGSEMVPCRYIHVYPRGRPDELGVRVEIHQAQRWYDDKRWKAPTFNWCAAHGGALTIQQAEAFRDTLSKALEEAKERWGVLDPSSGNCPNCGNAEDTEVNEKFDDDGRTAYHNCPKCGCKYELFFECQFVFDNVKVTKKGKNRGPEQDGGATAKSA